MSSRGSNAAATPRRGRPSRIDRAQIVAAARDMDPQTLTMQAVAERLGVDRKALNYHVSDRDGLLELVALDVLHTEMGRISLPDDGDWRQAVRVFARGMRDGMARTGALFDYVRIPLASGRDTLAPADQLIQTLAGAGFAAQDAMRILAFIAEFIFSSARDLVLTERHGVHPQLAEIQRLLDESPAADLPWLRRVTATEGTQAGEDQLEFDLMILISGLEKMLGA
jgi:TetR/AcrR family tetracycline transcriptional repressor